MSVQPTASERFTPPPIDMLPDAVVLDPAYKADPHSYYREWVTRPPFWARLDGTPVVIAARFADVDAVYSDWRRFSSEWPKHTASARFDYFNGLQDLVHTDPPAHTLLRGIISPAFAPGSIAKLEARVQVEADRLMAAAAAKHSKFEIMSEIAKPLSAQVLLGILLGIQEKDFPIFIALSNAMALLGPGPAGGQKPAAYEIAWNAAREFCDEVVAECRRTPRDDVVGRVIAAHESGQLSGDELLVMLMGLFLGGISTVASFIGNAFVQLLSWPGQYQILYETPRLLPNAVEEVLRYDSPGLFNYKFTTADADLGGVPIPEGTTVYLLQGATGFDPTVFEDAFTFDVRRKITRHLTFGRGVHVCIGAPIARLAARAALSAALRTFPHLQLANDAPIRYGGWAPERAPEAILARG